MRFMILCFMKFEFGFLQEVYFLMKMMGILIYDNYTEKKYGIYN